MRDAIIDLGARRWNHDSTSEVSCIFHHSQNGSFRSHQILKVNCQRITHVGCCIKRKPRENIKVCVNVLPTSYRQVTDTLPTVSRLSADSWPTVGRQTTNCRPTVGRQLTDSRPTGFLGSSSSQLPLSLKHLNADSRYNNNALAQFNDCIRGLLH